MERKIIITNKQCDFLNTIINENNSSKKHVPSAQEQVKNNESKILTVIVSADDKYYVENQEVSVDDLEKKLKSMAKDFPDGMMIESDGDASHGAVVILMDSARNSGITSISVTEI